MNKDDKLMYDTWIDDILDDVKNNVVGVYWHDYFDVPYFRKVLKHLIQRSKMSYKDDLPSGNPVLLFKYDNDYESESPTQTVNYIKDYLGINEDLNDFHTLYYFIIKHIFKTQGKDNILTESYSNPKLDKIVNHFIKRIEFDDDKELVSIKDYTDNHSVNTFLEYSTFCTYDTLETYIAGKIQWVLKHVYGLNKREVLEAGYKINNLIRDRLKNCDLKGRYNFDSHMTDKQYKKSIDYNSRLDESLSSEVNKKVDKLFKDDSTLKGEENIKNKFKNLFGMDDWVADHAMVLYLSKQQSLNESKGMDLKYLFKVADSIIKEIEISNDNFKVRGFGPWSDMSTGGRGFWVGLEKHSKDTYGLTKAETEMVSDIVWDSLNAKNILVYNEKHKKHYGSLREQHYEDWDERAREQNINLLKAKGIDILSTDSSVPFYKRIDSKEIRFLNKVADMLIKETKLEEADDIFDFIVYAPFGNYELKVLLNEYRHYGFEKYVNNVYAVGDNQIMFPTHNSISQASEGQFLWEMYKDKLRRKQIQMVNPGFDIPDDAIIIENDLTSDEHKSLLQSFEVMDTPEEIASEELGNMIKWVKDLPEILFLYRVLYLDDENQINYDELGSHYSQDRTDLINNHYDRGSIYGDMGEHAYLITVKVPKSEVDVMETLNNNILYPHEKEITLKNKGRGAQYLDVEKI